MENVEGGHSAFEEEEEIVRSPFEERRVSQDNLTHMHSYVRKSNSLVESALDGDEMTSALCPPSDVGLHILIPYRPVHARWSAHMRLKNGWFQGYLGEIGLISDSGGYFSNLIDKQFPGRFPWSTFPNFQPFACFRKKVWKFLPLRPPA